MFVVFLWRNRPYIQFGQWHKFCHFAFVYHHNGFIMEQAGCDWRIDSFPALTQGIQQKCITHLRVTPIFMHSLFFFRGSKVIGQTKTIIIRRIFKYSWSLETIAIAPFCVFSLETPSVAACSAFSFVRSWVALTVCFGPLSICTVKHRPVSFGWIWAEKKPYRPQNFCCHTWLTIWQMMWYAWDCELFLVHAFLFPPFYHRLISSKSWAGLFLYCLSWNSNVTFRWLEVTTML